MYEVLKSTLQMELGFNIIHNNNNNNNNIVGMHCNSACLDEYFTPI